MPIRNTCIQLLQESLFPFFACIQLQYLQYFVPAGQERVVQCDITQGIPTFRLRRGTDAVLVQSGVFPDQIPFDGLCASPSGEEKACMHTESIRDTHRLSAKILCMAASIRLLSRYP